MGSCGPAGAFATGQPLDAAPGGGALHGLAEYAAGQDDRFGGSTDDELTGIICALDRAEAAACALKHAAVAELIRRRPDSATEPALAGRWEEFTGTELSWALAGTRWAAETMLDLAHTLTVKLPGTYAAFRTGVLRQSKVEIIARAVAGLDPDEARAAEAKVLDRAGRLTPGGLRAAIRRAVIEVAPAKAARRRKDAERAARVERWREDSGNAGLAGRELPPADVLAADQRITWWARQLKRAGLDGDMDQLRARALMDIMLGRDSRVGAATDAGAPPAGIPPGAAANPQTTWCVTVTGTQGHAAGHGCARPQPRGQDPPRQTSSTPRQGFTFTATGQPGPPGGYGHWRLTTGLPGQRPLLITLDPSPWRTATTASPPAATTPASSSGTYPRSGTPPAPARPAAAPPSAATSSTTPPTSKAGVPEQIAPLPGILVSEGRW